MPVIFPDFCPPSAARKNAKNFKFFTKLCEQVILSHSVRLTKYSRRGYRFQFSYLILPIFTGLNGLAPKLQASKSKIFFIFSSWSLEKTPCWLCA